MTASIPAKAVAFERVSDERLERLAREYDCLPDMRSVLRELQRQRPNLTAARQELTNIATAKRRDPECFRDDSDFADWAQSRCRFTLGETE